MYTGSVVRKLFTLPEGLAEQLNREKNQSATVAEALALYYKHRETVRKLAENTARILEKLDTPVYQGISQQGRDEELESYRTSYASEGFQFRRHNGQIQVNKPPGREWVGVEVLEY